MPSCQSSHLPLKEYVTIDDVFDAYYCCRRNKRRTQSALQFEMDYERNLTVLHKELNDMTYRPGTSIAFCVKYPKIREVFAANFRDRVVHHLVENRLGWLFEKQMTDSAFACRKGRGTLYGVRHVQQDMRRIGDDGWYAKCDIEGFFMSIHRCTLMTQLVEIIIHSGIENPAWWLWLLDKIVMHRPEKDCVIRGDRSLWQRLPENKSLFHTVNTGLPIGNLTSQILANIYMSEFDRWIIEEIGESGGYGRYVDDFIIMHPDKAVVLKIKNRAREWLSENLGLKMHPRKTCVQQIRRGVRFIGTMIRGDCMIPSKRLVAGTMHLARHFTQADTERINSRMGLLLHHNSYGLRRSAWRIIADRKENVIFINNRKIKPRK